MKRYTFIILLSLLFTPFAPCLYAGESIQPPMGSYQLKDNELEALNEWSKILESFSPEELEELSKIGEEYMKELEAQGIDPMELLFSEDSPIWENPNKIDEEYDTKEEIPAKTPEALPVSTLPMPQPAVPQVPETLTIADKQKLEQVKHMLEDIADKINSLRQKAESKRSILEKLEPFEFTLLDIIYFVLTIKENHLIKYLVDKKFEVLYAALLELHTALESFEPQIFVTEFSLDGKDPYTILNVRSSDSFETIYKQYQKLAREENPFTLESHLKEQGELEEVILKKTEKARTRWNNIVWAYEALQAKEHSKHALERLLNALQKIVYSQNMIPKFKELLQAYDPEALKIKEDQEKKEKEARKAQENLAKQRPAWTQPVFEPPIFRPERSYDEPSYPSWFGGNTSSGVVETPEKAGETALAGLGKKEEAKKPEKKDDKKKDEKKKEDKKEEDKAKGKKNGGKKPEKKDEKKELTPFERKIIKVEDSLITIKKVIKEAEPLIIGLKTYLQKPYENDEDKEKAIKVNLLLTTITNEMKVVDKTIHADIEEYKNNPVDKNRYVKSIHKAYTDFKNDETIKQALDTLTKFESHEGSIKYQGQGFNANAQKQYIITGKVPHDRSLLSDELKVINNPYRTNDQDIHLNNMDNFKKAYTTLNTYMQETISKLAQESTPQPGR